MMIRYLLVNALKNNRKTTGLFFLSGFIMKRDTQIIPCLQKIPG